MNKLFFSGSTVFKELPFDYFDRLGFSVYVLDHNWCYLYVNEFVEKNLGKPASSLIGKNMWELYPELQTDPSFNQLRNNSEKGVMSNFITISPVTAQRLNVTGQPLHDCYFFTASVLPKKEDLIDELRGALPRHSR